MATALDLASLDSSRPHWVPAVTAPVRDWRGAPGCRPGARFLIDGLTLRPSRTGCPTFDSRADCLRWIMRTAPTSTATRRMPASPRSNSPNGCWG